MSQSLFGGRILRCGAIPERGGVLSLFRVRKPDAREVDVFHSVGAEATLDDPAKFPAGFPVYPGVNRLQDGIIQDWQGTQFDCKGPRTHAENLLHYTGPWISLRQKDAGETGVVMQMDSDQEASDFPWPGAPYHGEVSYQVVQPDADERKLEDFLVLPAGRSVRVIDAEALDIKIDLTLKGDGDTPLQALWHMMCNKEIDGDANPHVQYDATQYYVMGDGCIPTGEKKKIRAGLKYPRFAPFAMGADDCVCNWKGKGGLGWLEAGIVVLLIDKLGNCTHLQVWNGKDFEVCALEAQPTVANALNHPKRGKRGGPPIYIAKKAGDRFSTHQRIIVFCVQFLAA